MNRLKINELAKLYDITPHTLRYYEKIGLIQPDYDDNGYRNYSYKELEQLNTIRDLRYFDVSLPEIVEYLNNKNIDRTKELLRFEIDSLHRLIAESKEKISLLDDRLQLIYEVEDTPFNQPIVMEHQLRQVIKDDEMTTSDDVDYALKQLHKKHEKQLSANNQNLFGSILHEESDSFAYQVFYFYPETASLINEVSTLPSGKYLAYTYQGAYEQQDTGIQEMKKYAQTHQLELKSPFYELYLVDFHETNDQNEFITRLEVLIQ